MNVRQKTAEGFSRLFLGSCWRRLSVCAWLLAVLCAPPLAQATEHEEGDGWSRFNQYLWGTDRNQSNDEKQVEKFDAQKYLWGTNSPEDIPPRLPPEYEFRIGGIFFFIPLIGYQISNHVNPRKNSPEESSWILSFDISFLWKDTWGMEAVYFETIEDDSYDSTEDLATDDEMRRSWRSDYSEHIFYMLLRRFSLSPALKLDVGIGYSPFSLYTLKVLERGVTLDSEQKFDFAYFSGSAKLVRADMQYYFKFLNYWLKKVHLSLSMGAGVQYMEPDYETKRIPDYFLDGVGTGEEVDFKPGNPIITYYIYTYYSLVF